jgi:ankyrin repeat protein
VFPNPHDALPLPARPNLERYRKIAKDLTKACRSGDPDAFRHWARSFVETLVDLTALTVSPGMPVDVQRWIDQLASFAQKKMLAASNGATACRLTDAQFVIARSHGFASWQKFATHLEALAHAGSDARFEAAVEAVVAGDVARLRQLLADDPAMVHQRSSREHHATLLHYVAANGVEGYRQKTPSNIVEIAELLLAAGANVDAVARLYGTDCTTLGLAATSVHPERAGVQQALLARLLAHGAEIDRPASAGRSPSIVAACLANGRLEAAAYLVERGARLDFAGACGLGRLDVVRSYCRADGDGAPRRTGDGTDVPLAELREGFMNACAYGRREIVALLLDHSAGLATQPGAGGQTGLHCAIIGCHVDVVRLLVDRGASLVVENDYGGTPFGQALWCAAHGGDAERYVAILEVLERAGAAIPDRHAPVNRIVDEWLARHGASAELTLRWSNE